MNPKFLYQDAVSLERKISSQFICLQEYKKRLLLRCMHHFKSDLINIMDHMRISGTEPSSVVLSQTK